jgi:hypothetical protein
MKLDRIQWNWAGWNEVRKSSGVQALLMEKANQMAGNAGDGYKVAVFATRAIVWAESEEAQKDNLQNNTLLKSRR